jgi:glycosyltransferase involved in cell wall biosynthesis
MQKFYIIKSTGAWIMDELAAFAEVTKFNILFTREQDKFYSDKINLLEKKGVKIIYLKHWENISFPKIFFCFIFLIKHIKCFFNLHSFVYGIKSIGYFLKLDLKLFNEDKVDLHCQFATQSTILGMMLKEYFNSNISYSFTFHAYDIFVKNLWFSTLTDNAGKVFSISNYNINYVIKHYNIINSKKIYYSPLGVFPPANPKKSESGYNPNILRIGFLSYFVEMKGINYLLPAIKQLKKTDLPFILNIAGDGPQKEKMFSYVEKNYLKENVIFHGLIKDEKKDLFFRNLDLFILPSISKGMETDGLPVVLMEAVSYGLPIISTNISGIPEICVNDYNGYLIEQKSIEEIVNAIIKFSENSSRWLEFSQNSLEISRKYDITTNSGLKLKMLGWE